MAVLAIGMVGAGLSSAAGIGAAIGWSAGVMLGNLLLGQDSQTVEGSRLDDLSVQSSTYGGTIQLVYGTMRVAGNVIWSTDLKETRHESSGGKGGMMGGGAKQVSYTYSVSFAVGLCAGPTATVRRIWADTKLIYDATADNTQSMEKQPGVIRIHLGTEDQESDSTIEMHEGVGKAPAYRGMCYLVFTDLELEDFANRIPSISAEIVGNGAMDCNAETFPAVPGAYRDGGILNASDGTLTGFTINSSIYKYNLINGKLLFNVPFDEDHDLYGSLYGLDGDGHLYHASDAYGVGMHLVKRHRETLAVMAKTTKRIPFTPSGAVCGDKIFCYYSREIYNTRFRLEHDLSEVLPFYSSPGAPMCEDGNGNIWQVGHDKIRRVRLNALGVKDVVEWDIAAWTDSKQPDVAFWDDTTGHIYFKINTLGRLIKWDIGGGYVAHVDGLALEGGYSFQADNSFPMNGKFWSASGHTATLTNLTTMRLEKTIDLTPFLTSSGTHFAGCYEKFTHSAVIMTSDGQIKYPLERYGSDKVSLAGILSDLCLRAGLKQTDFLTSAVDQSVLGYVVSGRCSTRKALEPLLGTYFIDAIETDGVLKFVPRGQAVTASIPYDDLGAVEGSSNENPVRITETREQEVELPLRIDLTHYDPERDYQTNTQHAARSSNAVTTRDKESLELSIVLDADEAAQVAEKTLTYAWIGRTTASFDLPPKWLRLNPTDVITLALKDVDLKLRLTQVDFGANNIVSCQAAFEDAIAYSSNKKGTAVNLPAVPIVLATPISAFIMDLPMLREADDGMGLYYAFGIKNTGSASLYRSADAVTWDVVGTGSEFPAYGWASTVLGQPQSPWSWDEDNTLQVVLANGELDSKTALEVLNWANTALLGDEIIQWKTATLIAENTYELSDLLRGRRGTEWAVSEHSVGERFVVLEKGALYRMAMGQSQLNQTAYYKALPLGGDWDDARQLSQNYKAASLRCFAPVQIKGEREASGNLSFSWIRRPRWNGEWMDEIDVPLYEAEESYQIDILNGDDVVRTLESNEPVVVYVAEDQTIDFGSAQGSVSVAIYQMNDTIGRGYAGKAIL